MIPPARDRYGGLEFDITTSSVKHTSTRLTGDLHTGFDNRQVPDIVLIRALDYTALQAVVVGIVASGAPQYC